MELASAIAGMIDGIRAEKAALHDEHGAPPTTRLLDGRCTYFEPGAYGYAFSCSLDERVPEGSRLRIDAPGLVSTGEVLGHEPDEQRLECEFRDDLGAEVPEAVATFDVEFLLDELMNRLEEIAEAKPSGGGGGSPPGAVAEFHTDRALRFLHGAGEPVASHSVTRSALSAVQNRAIAFVGAQDVSYLWGPPGTGKTTTVGHLVHELNSRGERVLLAAHTNVATDHALLKTMEAGSYGELDVVRVGFHSEALRARRLGLEEVTDLALRIRHQDLVAQAQSLCAKILSFLKRPPKALSTERAAIPRRLRAGRDALRNEGADDPELHKALKNLLDAVELVEMEVLREAKVVGSTLTRLYTSARLKQLRTDVLVLDEASVAPIPLAFLGACHARKRAIAVGDFMQLPPIVLSRSPRAKQWLGSHVFATAGCHRPDQDHPLRVMLEEQWRMHPRIAEVVSEVFYAGRLKTAEDHAARLHRNPAALLIDTSGLQTRSHSTPAGSKLNEKQAALTCELAVKCAALDIAVISPYRAQVRAIRERIRAIAPQRLGSGGIEVFTVHRFQGRDKDVVILDLVDAEGTEPRFLDDIQNPGARFLLNVAISRARKRLIVVADVRYLAARLGKPALANRIFAHVRLRGEELEAAMPADSLRLGEYLTEPM